MRSGRLFFVAMEKRIGFLPDVRGEAVDMDPKSGGVALSYIPIARSRGLWKNNPTVAVSASGFKHSIRWLGSKPPPAYL